MIFSGEFEHKIDKQGRVSIPARFRNAFSSGIVISRGFDKCIVGYTLEEWNKVADEISKIPTTSTLGRKVARFTFSNAYTLEVDNHGRVLIPNPLRSYAQIKETCSLIGTGKLLEFWAQELWVEERVSITKTAEQLNESTNNLAMGEPN